MKDLLRQLSKSKCSIDQIERLFLPEELDVQNLWLCNYVEDGKEQKIPLYWLNVENKCAQPLEYEAFLYDFKNKVVLGIVYQIQRRQERAFRNIKETFAPDGYDLDKLFESPFASFLSVDDVKPRMTQSEILALLPTKTNEKVKQKIKI